MSIKTLLAVILALTLAAGCGEKEGPSSKTPAPKSIEGLNVKGIGMSQYISQAIEQNDKGNYAEALDLLKKAYEANSADESIKKGITTVYNNFCARLVKSGEYERAERNFEEALELIGGNPDMEKKYALVLTKHAQSEFDAGNRQNAVKLLETAVMHDGSNADILGLLGDYYYKIDNNKGAIECWEKAFALNPADYGLQEKLDKASREHKVESAFMTQRLKHFEVKFNDIETYNIAWDVLKLLDDAYSEIGGEYDELPQDRFTVIIYAGREFDEALMMPDWVAGLYDGKIRVRLGDLKGGESRLKGLLYHEYTHALLYYMVGSNIPLSLNEGIAQYEEPGSVITQAERDFLKARVKDGSLLSITQLDSVFHHKNSSVEVISLAYLEAKSLLHWISDKYGRYSIRLFLRELKDSGDMTMSLKKAFGVDLNGLESGWRELL